MTPETFALWKKDRLDKKAAEEEARKAKEATGKAMFESGDWKGSDDESDTEDESDADDGVEEDENDGAWNLEAMRRETERLRALKEEERLAKAAGEPLPNTNGVNGHTTTSDLGEEDADEGDG